MAIHGLMASFSTTEMILKNGRMLELRHCSPADAFRFPEFVEKAARESTNTLQYEGRRVAIEQVERTWRAAENDPGALYLGAFDGGRIVGQVSFRQNAPDHPWIRHIGEFGMLVLEEFWGQGLGTRFLHEMEAFAETIGVRRIEAKVRTNNERGIGLYRKLGYAIEGTRKRAAFIRGSYLDEYFIAKLLS